MRLMNIFPQLALANEISSTATATIVVLNILTSLTKRSLTKSSALLRQIAVKFFHYWINLANEKQPVSIRYLQD